jgi:DNA-binding response OmpR family regulator
VNNEPPLEQNPGLSYRLDVNRSVSRPVPRILVVDDQPDIRTMISIVLRVHRFEIVGAATGAAAIKEFENSKFDLAIVDIFLQGSNGLDVIRKMRERIPGFPLIAISGMTTLDYFSGSPELSDIICLRMPFRSAELVRAVEAAGLVRPSVSGEMEAAGSCQPQ